jgi:hypothetical protein
MSYQCPYCSDSCKNVARYRAHIRRKRECREKHEHRLQKLASTTHRTPIRRTRRKIPRLCPPENTANASNSVADQQEPLAEDGAPEATGMDLDVEPMDDAHYEQRHRSPDDPAPQAFNGPPHNEPEHNTAPFNETPPRETPPLPLRPTTHGYATVRPHPNAARSSAALDNELPMEENNENPLGDPEWFELGEWLAHLPISNAQRSKYFEFKRVSGRSLSAGQPR